MLVVAVITLFGVSGMCNDFDVFCELVSLSSIWSSNCTTCSSPCGNKGCGVTCSVDNTSITGINAYYKVPLGPNSDTVYGMGLTTLPENICSLTSLTSL